MIFFRSNLFKTLLIPTYKFNKTPIFQFGILEDKLQQRNKKKMDEQFKKQIESLANKPTYTLLDFKQRINDQLNKIQKGIASKLSKQNKQTQQQLEIQRKLLAAFFDEQLLQQIPLNGQRKLAISLVTRIPYDKILDLQVKFRHQLSMHKMLRELHLNNEPLPQTLQQLIILQKTRGYSFISVKQKMKSRFAKRSKQQRLRMMKFKTF